MKFVSWNVNGVRAAARKGFEAWLESTDADVVALQEIKARPEQLEESLRAPQGWHVAWNPASRAGYSGTATFSRKKPGETALGIGIPRFDDEGRILVTRHGKIVHYNVYFPNGGQGDERLRYKLDFYDALLEHLEARVAAGDSIVVCGDLNTAHREIDLARPRENRKISGFMPVECEALDRWFERGWIDAFRTLHPDLEGAYSWWSMRSGARSRNVGWRLDYHLVSRDLGKRLKQAAIHKDVEGSDHCPVSLVLR